MTLIKKNQLKCIYFILSNLDIFLLVFEYVWSNFDNAFVGILVFLMMSTRYKGMELMYTL